MNSYYSTRDLGGRRGAGLGLLTRIISGFGTVYASRFPPLNILLFRCGILYAHPPPRSAANRQCPFSLNPLFPWHAVPFPHEHGERGFGGERAASLEHIGGGEAAVEKGQRGSRMGIGEREGATVARGRLALSGAPDCASALYFFFVVLLTVF